MKKFISILIALFAILTIQAQQFSLDKTYSNIYVVQQHIDVGVTIQPNYIYTYQTFSAPVSVVVNSVYNTTFTPMTVYSTNPINYYTSYTEQYRRGVGLINDYVINRNNIIETTNLVRDVYTQNNYKNVQKYYCN